MQVCKMDFVNQNWKEGIAPLLNYLTEISEDSYRDFSKKITPGEFVMLGVKIPTLREIAKSIFKGDYKAFLELDDENIYEVRLIKGFVISNIKNFQEYDEYFEKFLPSIDNWAVCDTFLSGSKIIKKNRPYYFKRIGMLLLTRDEYENRVAFVMLLTYFVDEEYLNRVFELLKGYKSDKYYANMAIAWLISVMYAKFPEETKVFLLENKFDKEVTKYILRKIKDSYRVSLEDKEWLKNIS